ncbi:Cyclin-dependent protein kinase inhibitor SMR13 [Glycine soja]|uniref:Cyclin-dependent protein kinase inhibitor SMR13 n=1 Tax=Glycine soja TaxID=3848 RepID=A0A445LRU5_GLYSO|nr:Cyclin-dependent protein kinase inhibitor SMR13 [Glycine soja]
MAPVSTRTRMKCKKLEGKKQQKKKSSMVYDATTPTSSATKEIKGEDLNEEDICSSVCSTPKGKRFRIPKVLTCPPAPKKRRVTSCSSSKNKRSPIAFFASPDIELFFFSAIKSSVPASSFTPSGV